MNLDEIMALRKTTRSYTDEPVSEEDIQAILRAGETAPLALSDDETTFITVVQDPELLSEIREVCKKKYKNGTTKDSYYGAPVIIYLSAADVSPDHIEYSNVACVIENMILKATELGLGSTYVWGCLRKLRASEETVEKLKLPDGAEVLSALAIGHPVEALTPRDVTEKMRIMRL